MSQPTVPVPTFGIIGEFTGADALGPFVSWADGRDYHVDQIPADAPAGTSFVVGGQGGVVQADGTFYRACGRCGGTGKTPFTWVLGGDCFDCGGTAGAGTYRTIAEENKLARARIEPRSIIPAEGDRVAFTAELVEGREPDPQFRIGKRPTKARIVEAAPVPEVG